MKKKQMKTDQAILSPEVIECLTKAGWTSTRHIGLEKYQAAFEDEHMELPSKVRTFLSQFGGLIIRYKRRYKREDTLDFLADEAVEGLGGTVLRLYEDAINAGKLFPIGHFGCDTCLLMMTRSGKVYGGADWKIIYVGQTGLHAIENIITGSEMEIITDDSRL